MRDEKKQAAKAVTKATDSLPSEQDIGRRVKATREALGLNFEQFAALTKEYDPEGIAAVTLRRYERSDDGGSFPGIRELRILCDALDVSADFLIRGDESDEDKRDRQDWEQLKGLIRRMATPSPLPGSGKRDPYRNMERTQKLQRARLHSKLKDQ